MPASYSADNSRRWIVIGFPLAILSLAVLTLMQQGIIPAPGPDGWDWPGEKGKEWDPKWDKDFPPKAPPNGPNPGPNTTPPPPSR